MSTTPGMSAPPPAPPADKPSRRGCLIAVLIAVVVLVMGCGGACFYMAKNPGKMMAWGMSQMKNQAMAVVAPDVPPETRQAFEAEMDAFVEWAPSARPGSGTDASAMQAPFQHLQTAVSDKSITADEIQRFIELSRKARGADTP
jgi:hypothetical protein